MGRRKKWAKEEKKGKTISWGLLPGPYWLRYLFGAVCIGYCRIDSAPPPHVVQDWIACLRHSRRARRMRNNRAGGDITKWSQQIPSRTCILPFQFEGGTRALAKEVEKAQAMDGDEGQTERGKTSENVGNSVVTMVGRSGPLVSFLFFDPIVFFLFSLFSLLVFWPGFASQGGASTVEQQEQAKKEPRGTEETGKRVIGKANGRRLGCLNEDYLVPESSRYRNMMRNIVGFSARVPSRTIGSPNPCSC